MEIRKKKHGRLATLVALIATVICAGIAAFAGVFGGFGNGVQTASANAASGAYNIGGSTAGTFDANGLQKLMGQIMGKSTASYNELKAFIDKQPDKQFESSKFNNNAGYFTVKLGGMDWNVVFASEDTSGEVVATLWQASSSLHAQWNPWYSTDKTLYYPSNMYGTSFIRASLVNSQYAARAMDETTTGMSGSGSGWDSNRKFMDYINTTNAVQTVTKVKINRTTGLPIMSGTAEATMSVSVPVNQVYQTYHPLVVNYGKYFDTPSQIPWQWYQSNRKIYGTAWYGDCKNDGLFGATSGNGGAEAAPSGWWSPDDDYTGKNGYSNWGGDKIWLPSGYETGYNNGEWAGQIYPNPSQRSGFWGLPSAARQNATTAVTQTEIDNATKNANASNYTDATGAAANNGQTNMDNSSWLRSGNHASAYSANSVNSGGSLVNPYVTDLRAVRPALHLNLKSAASAAGLVIEAPTFDTTTNVTLTNNNTVATLDYSGAAKEINLTTPATGVSVTVTAPASYNGTTKKISVTDAGTYTVTLSCNAGYSWSDGSIGSKNLTVVVKPKSITAVDWKYNGSAIPAAGVAYTGSPIIVTASYTGVGSDGTVALPIAYAGDNINVGTFKAVAINNDSNYSIASSLLSQSVQITKKSITPVWDTANNATVTYDGEDHAPAAWYIASTGEKIYLPVTLMKEGTTAGTYDVPASNAITAGKYKATVAANTYNGNYTLATAASIEFEVEKVQISANDVEWSFVSGAKFAPNAKPSVTALFRFNNQAYVLDVDFAAAPSGTGNVTTWTVGDYTATAKLGTDAKFANFALAGTISRDLRITDSATGKYTVIWEGFSSIVTYNGQDQKPKAYIIVDGEKIMVNVGILMPDTTVNYTNPAKNAGTYTYVASLTGYTLDNQQTTQRIDPRTISVVYNNLTGLQHGALDGSNNPIKVTASTLDPVAKDEYDNGKLKFVVTGDSNKAGTRVVTAEAQSQDGGLNWVTCNNYVISNASAVQTVGKKVLTDTDITWKNSLTYTYDGNIKIPEGTVNTSALAGGDTGSVYVIFEFVYAVEVGTYSVKVLGISNDNYTFEGTKTLTITADGSQTVQWEGLQNGASSTYNGLNQLPKPYIVIGGEKVYLAVDSLTRGGVATNSAILAGSYVATVNAKTTGDYTYAQATITFTISPYELKTIYLTQNVFIYSGNNNVIEVYALGVNNEKVVISNRNITKNGTAATNCIDAGSYVVTVSSGALDDNYTIASTVNSVSFVVNPMSVTVNFGNLASWVFTDGNNPAITITASVANAVEVKYGKFGTVNTPVADNGSGSFTIAANSMSSLIGQKGMISVAAKNGNYQISGQSFQTFEVVSSVTTATVDFKLDSNGWTDDNKTFTYGDSAAIAVSGSDGVEIKYYKDGVLLTNPITDVSNLDAGTYLITASHASLNLTSNVSGTSRSFKVNPKAVDLSSASWVIDGNAVASNSVAYNGQIYNASLNLGSHASDFDVYYTNGANKNVGSVTTKATVVPKSGNYVATNVSDTYSWNITEATATVAWNDNGTVANITGDNATATGGSFFVKEGAAYKVVYKKNGVVLNAAPTEAGDYTAEVMLALGNDNNVKVNAQSFSFQIGSSSVLPPDVGGNTNNTDNGGMQSWWWILLVVLAVLAIFIAIIALIKSSRKKDGVYDADGFYDDVTPGDFN